VTSPQALVSGEGRGWRGGVIGERKEEEGRGKEGIWTPISYRRSIVTLLQYRTASDLLAYFSTQPDTGSDVVVVSAAGRRLTGFKMSD